VEYTNEAGCWGKAGIQKDKVNFTLEYGRTQRTGSNYLTNPDGTPPQNPLMRIYTMADRNRDEFKARIDVSPGEHFNFGVDTRVSSDDYFSSVIGLLDGRSWSTAFDCSWMISDKASATCYASHELIESRQANADSSRRRRCGRVRTPTRSTLPEWDSSTPWTRNSISASTTPSRARRARS
jgi:hypothetical protein